MGIAAVGAILKLMPDSTSTKPKPRHARLRRWLKLVCVTTLLVIIAAVIGMKWAYDHRLQLVNDVLHKMGPLSGSAVAVEFDRAGNIEMRGLELDGPDHAKMMTLPSIKIALPLTSLLHGEIESVTLDHPDIDLYEKKLASLMNQGSEGHAAGRTGLPFGLKIRKLHIEKANLSYEEKNGATADIVLY